ncbi:MAG TPA: Dot/Icm T4SS effector Zinc-dependent metalloprotease LegP, partial [Pyrinomonadaceae bacterium]|nr:Dot/Icm T4SS effector Zinc-dependent metalloprotease LegP [Pyrinomonadaceae bacterium]
MATRSSKKSRAKASTKDNTPRSAEGEHRTGPVAGTALVAGVTFGLKGLLYADVDGLALFEGDIVLGTTEDVQATMQTTSDENAGFQPQASVVISGQQFRWPNATIPYEIDPALPDKQRINDAIAHWQANTPIRFVQRAGQPDYVRFVPGDGCSSMVGKRGGRQDITLTGGCTAGNVIHEIGHTVGLWHEQSREDRDTFIRIVWANIDPAAQHNFSQQIADGDDIGPYDYGSVMHYPPTAFSINGQPTIIPLQPLGAGVVMGQRTGLSQNDIKAVKTIYPTAAPTVKETVKDPITDPSPTIKEARKDPIQDTIKETRKDPIQDATIKETRKDPIQDTAKEARKDPIFDPIPIPGLPRFNFDPNAGATPFITATQSRFGGQADAAAEASAQVAELAQALVSLEQQQAELLAAYDQALQTLA